MHSQHPLAARARLHLRDLPLHMLTDEEWAELERTGQV